MKAAGASLATALVAGCSTGENGGEGTTTGSGGDADEDATSGAADDTAAADDTPADAPDATEETTDGTAAVGLDANETGETDDFQTPNTEPPPTVDQDSDNETES